MAKPHISESAFIAETASICGNVFVGENCSVYFNATLRGDRKEILVGDGSNIQDNCVIHASPVYPVHIGRDVSIGHGAIIHGCTIGDNVLVGMGAIIMNDVEIGENCMIGAGTLLTQHKKIPPNSLVMGVPGKVVRELTGEDVAKISHNAEHYRCMSAEHKAGVHELYDTAIKGGILWEK